MTALTAANWPEEALAVIRASGVEETYHHLRSVIPDIKFEDGKRYDTAEQIVDPNAAVVKEAQPAEGGRYEAEQANLSGGAKVKKKHSGFSGTGYVGEFYNTQGAQVTFSVEAEEMGTVDVILRYAAGHQDSTCFGIYVNGEKSEMLTIPSTGAWDTWAIQKISVFLKSGMNTISFNAESTSPDVINIDYIQITN